MIYCIGNSHVNFFTDTHVATNSVWKSDTHGVFNSYAIGPVIAYNFTNHHLPKVIQAILSIDNFKPKEDYVMLIVGEVDCRWHLPKQASDQEIEIEEVVEECIDRFFDSMLALKERGCKVIGWGGHPSTTEGHSDDLSKPIFGGCKNRNRVSIHFESYYKQKCLDNKIPFISILGDIIKRDGLTNMEFFIDYCHLKTDPLIFRVLEKAKQRGLV